eukprot:TRINITY_DN4257_c0_g1_i3.p1 TRINITY_DN4257_c0_g1~~TRINITY_DN4257_c0_g1_i3.p1  ORF type:complete len:477 (-),score=109.31 TRINITY_DN4257_c0_g1_i3:68-1498(-)
MNVYASSSASGGCMSLYLHSTKKHRFVNFRERAPLAATPDMFDVPGTSSFKGGLAIGVPGEVKGLEYAWETYGSGLYTWEELVSPSIDIADSFVGHKRFYILSKQFEILEYPDRDSWAEIYLKEEGETIKNPKLAETLRIIAKEGSQAFYNGSLTDMIVQELREIGSIITREDFIQYEIKDVEPLYYKLDEYDIYTAPPPFSGAVIAQIVNMAEILKPEYLSNEYEHTLAEILKFGFANRLILGDPDFDDMTEYISKMISMEHAQTLSQRFNEVSQDPDYYLDLASQMRRSMVDHGTSHFSIIDKDLNAVSLTHTVNSHFGSGVVGKYTGMLYNNQMDDFFLESYNNDIQPFKQPVSSTSPTIVMKDGFPHVIIGAAGGPTIVSTIANNLIRLLLLGDNIRTSIDMPRIHSAFSEDILLIEENLEENTKNLLQEKGHKLYEIESFGTVNGIVYNQGKKLPISAWADSRRFDIATGY